MGELIETYGTIDIKGHKLKIELNAPVEDCGGIIHLQSDNFRCEMSQEDFYKIVTTMNLAKKQLLKIKGIDENE